MSNIDFEFELTGLKIKIKGDGEDVSGKVAQLQRQVHSLMSTIGALAQGTASPSPHPNVHENGAGQLLDATQTRPVLENPASLNGSRRRRQRRNPSGAPKQTAEAIDFKHDAEKYGFPKQIWTTSQKAMWMIFVLGEHGDEKEFSASVIAATFNKHFKSFGTIRMQNVLRDLGKEKGKSGAVNSDASQDPMKWYLLDAGKKLIPALIEESKGQPAE